MNDKFKDAYGGDVKVLIDSHVHLGGPDRGDGTSLSAEELIQRMDAVGVDRAVVFPFNEINPGVSFSKANDFIASSVAVYPERLIGFARLDPNAGSASLKELDRAIVDRGLKGIKLHPKGQNFTPENKHVLKIVESAAEHNVPLVFDNGKDVFDNLAIGRLAQKVPEAVIIMAHMRGEGFIEVPLQQENVFLGTVKAKPEDLVRAINTLGAGKVIAGSDSPYVDMAYEMKGKFDRVMELSSSDRGLIQGGNLQRIMSSTGLSL